jgi:CrcB protein
MLRFLFIALGGAIGTGLRYIVSSLDYKFSNGVFPISTLVVNLSGSLVIGFLWGLFERSALSPTVRMFVFIGILGGFTTFSTFALEGFNLIRDGEFKIAFINVIVSNLIGIVLVFVGFSLARLLMVHMKGAA